MTRLGALRDTRRQLSRMRRRPWLSKSFFTLSLSETRQRHGGRIAWVFACVAGFFASTPATVSAQLPPSLRIETGSINRVVIQRGDEVAIVYGPPSAEFWKGKTPGKAPAVGLLTTFRRDVSFAANAWRHANAPQRLVAPQDSQVELTNPLKFWEAYPEARFDDMNQQTIQHRGTVLPVTTWVASGDHIVFADRRIEVLATPGYTRDAISYLVELDGRRVAFVGDLIYGDGQLLDLFSFQDAIHSAKIRGYHGYASRCAELIRSLRTLRDRKLDLLVPARGPVIDEPQVAIDRLIRRVQRLYANYLSTSALHWYFKADNMRRCAERILDDVEEPELMPYAEHVANPDWMWNFATSRLIISESGRAILLDCWNEQVINAVQQLQNEGRISGIDAIFVTHSHNDHTAAVQSAAETFGCPVWSLESYADVLERPGAYHLPALTSAAVEQVSKKKNGERVRWREFELTFFDFPGQTIHHGALLVKTPEEGQVLFVGDSFAPSGFDDYCVWNRNLLGEEQGYLACLKLLRRLPPRTWLVNQHIPYLFRFSEQELDYLETRYRERISIQRELFPWDDPNYGVDPQWATFVPRVVSGTPGEVVQLNFRLTNHSPRRRVFKVIIRDTEKDCGGEEDVDGGLKEVLAVKTVELSPREVRRLAFEIEIPQRSGSGLITADILSEGMRFSRWAEALLQISAAE